MIMLTLSPLGCFLSQVDEDIRPWALSSDIVNILSTYLEHGPKKILSLRIAILTPSDFKVWCSTSLIQIGELVCLAN